MSLTGSSVPMSRLHSVGHSYINASRQVSCGAVCRSNDTRLIEHRSADCSPYWCIRQSGTRHGRPGRCRNSTFTFHAHAADATNASRCWRSHQTPSTSRSPWFGSRLVELTAEAGSLCHIALHRTSMSTSARWINPLASMAHIGLRLWQINLSGYRGGNGSNRKSYLGIVVLSGTLPSRSPFSNRFCMDFGMHESRAANPWRWLTKTFAV